jgi:FkbM family methyltransferase
VTDPIRIAYLGNFSRTFCTEVHVAAALEALGHEVIRLQENETPWPSIPTLCDERGAQVLLWTRTWPADLDEVLPELARLRDSGVPTVSFHLDRWWGLDREHQVADQPFFHTQLVVSPDDSPRWDEAGVNHLWMPPGVHGPECAPVEPNRRRWPYDVVFVGSYPYPHPEWAAYREQLIRTCKRAFKGRFAVLPRQRRNAPIRGADLQELYATAKVVIGDSCLAGETHAYWSDRVPETLGRGGLLIHPRVDGMDGWYSDEDLLLYDLGHMEQVEGFASAALDDPAGSREVADHGRATVLGRDTYEHRMAALLEHVEATLPMRPLADGWSSPVVPVPSPLEGAVSDPEVVERVQVRQHRWRASYDCRPGTTDRQVVEECWGSNDYRVAPQGFRGGTVLDIGANIGAFTVLAAKAGAGMVWAVEPETANAERLAHHVDVNHVGDRVEIIREAVTAEVGAELAMAGTGGGALLTGEAGGVRTTSMPALLAHTGPVGFLKMDIEGGEYDALLACPPSLLREQVSVLAMEWHGPVMPHLAHLDDGRFLERWGQLVALLADCGHVEMHGHPRAGGLLWWRSYH